jgi:hypothetical protein
LDRVRAREPTADKELVPPFTERRRRATSFLPHPATPPTGS